MVATAKKLPATADPQGVLAALPVTCISKNGKRAREVCTKHRFTHLKRKLAISSLPLPSLALLALTKVKQTIS